MEPTLHGCEVVVLDTDPTPSNIQQGDIIAFEHDDGQQMMHRVIQVHWRNTSSDYIGGYETKGDGNEETDALSYHRDVIGEVEHVLRPPTCSG
jgi:signal peptidase I